MSTLVYPPFGTAAAPCPPLTVVDSDTNISRAMTETEALIYRWRVSQIGFAVTVTSLVEGPPEDPDNVPYSGGGVSNYQFANTLTVDRFLPPDTQLFTGSQELIFTVNDEAFRDRGTGTGFFPALEQLNFPSGARYLQLPLPDATLAFYQNFGDPDNIFTAPFVTFARGEITTPDTAVISPDEAQFLRFTISASIPGGAFTTTDVNHSGDTFSATLEKDGIPWFTVTVIVSASLF
jgi:hypothetical protein